MSFQCQISVVPLIVLFKKKVKLIIDRIIYRVRAQVAIITVGRSNQLLRMSEIFPNSPLRGLTQGLGQHCDNEYKLVWLSFLSQASCSTVNCGRILYRLLVLSDHWFVRNSNAGLSVSQWADP